MSCNTEEDFTLQDAFDEELSHEDYGFVLDGEGNLKSVFVPTDMMEIPDQVRVIFKMFGIKDPHRVDIQTVH